MIVGQGRAVSIAVVATGVALPVLLFATIVADLHDNGPWLWAWARGRLPPPPDRSLASQGPRGNPGLWFGSNTYPLDAVRAGEEGRTVARLSLDASGSPTGCVIVTSSNSAILDRATCSVLMRRAKYAPARDGDGVAIASTTVVPVRWVLPTDP